MRSQQITQMYNATPSIADAFKSAAWLCQQANSLNGDAKDRAYSLALDGLAFQLSRTLIDGGMNAEAADELALQLADVAAHQAA